MVSKKEINQQLKAIGFNNVGWGRTEVSELPHIILPKEKIAKAVNGVYEGGFALLVATDIRVLLIDKKPLSYLTVEDMRYDMISEMDYSHRLFGARINITSGGKNLAFRSYNKVELRDLIGYVQHCMADNKKKESNHQDSQVSHLEQINKQLQTYLVAQHQYQIELQKSATAEDVPAPIEPPKPSGELSDFLYAQSLISKYNETHNVDLNFKEEPKPEVVTNHLPVDSTLAAQDDVYEEGYKEVFGNNVSKSTDTTDTPPAPQTSDPSPLLKEGADGKVSFNVSPSRIAFSKLPMVSRQRKFSRHVNGFQPVTDVSN